MDGNLVEKDITTEKYREYDFINNGHVRVYRIENPVKLFYRAGGETHRVVDSTNTVHCLPAPGEKGCVLRWENNDTENPVNF